MRMLGRIYRWVLDASPASLVSMVRQGKNSALRLLNLPKRLNRVLEIGSANASGSDGMNPLDFVRPQTIAEIYSHLNNPVVLLQIQLARQVIARDRAQYFFRKGAARTISQAGAAVAYHTVEHNLAGAQTAPILDRPMIMINVVSSIERIARNRGSLDVLSVGPRSEIELFGLYSAGFSKDRIQALDLISYSPFVKLGDMHAMPYADNSFDIALLGWVLSYSRDQQTAAQEIVRVCRDRAIVAIACDYSDESSDGGKFR